MLIKVGVFEGVGFAVEGGGDEFLFRDAFAGAVGHDVLDGLSGDLLGGLDGVGVDFFLP